MCGIAGAIGAAWNSPRFDSLLASLARRGPDDHGLWREPGVAFGHRRLSIIDLSARAHNPMFNEDGNLVLVFNGEIFNYRELRAELAAKGHRFQSAGDAEVLLHLYEEEGSRLCRRLEGMYAFAVWDRRARQLFAARDPFGEKPFYYWVGEHGDAFCFASSLTALARSGLVPVSIAIRPIARYLLFGACVGVETPVAGVLALPPGGQVEYSAAGRTLRTGTHTPISSLASSPDAGPEDATLSWEVIAGAVARRMIADVPVGVFLSGGVDSTTVATAVRELAPGHLKSFSVGYESAHHTFDETEDARSVAAVLGTEHHAEVVTADDFARSLDPISEASDLPSHNGVNTFFASRLAARHVKVAMTGIGGDELFGGYSTFRYEHAATSRPLRPVRLLGWALAPVWRPLVEAAEETGRTSWPLLMLEQSRRGFNDPFYRWFQVRRLSSPRIVRGLLRPDPAVLEETGADGWGPHRRRLRDLFGVPEGLTHFLPLLECAGYLSPVLLRDSDAMSMHHGLELRVPFLDTDMVRSALALAAAVPTTATGDKRSLRNAITGRVPDRCLRKRKQGFGVPLAAWLRHPAVRRAVVEGLAAPPRLAAGIFQPSALSRMVQRYYDRPEGQVHYRLSARVWMTYSLMRWLHSVAERP